MENEVIEANNGYSLIRVRKIIKTKKPQLLDVSKLNNSRIDEDSDEKPEDKSIFKCCSDLGQKFSRNIHITLTVLTTIFCYYFYIFRFLIPFFQETKIGLDFRFYLFLDDSHYRNGFLYFIIFHYCFFWFVFSFLKISFTDPGYIHKEYTRLFAVNNINDDDQESDDFLLSNPNPDLNEFEKVFSDNEEQSKDGEIKKRRFFHFLYDNANIPQALERVCKFCLVIKPPRAHHCRTCRRCILKMDHHCKFVNNCIGFKNYKYYMIFLFYSTIMCMFLLVTMIEGISFYLREFGWESLDCKLFIVGYIYIFSIFVAVIDLFIFHLGIICKGTTTIEHKEEKIETSDLRSQDCMENFKEIMGENIFLWIFPFRTSNKYGGYYFEYMKDASDSNNHEVKYTNKS